MTRDEAITYLTGENLSVPCSRYGRTAAECAPVAADVASILAQQDGREPTNADLDAAMGFVVNDSDDVDYLIRNYGHEVGIVDPETIKWGAPAPYDIEEQREAREDGIARRRAEREVYGRFLTDIERAAVLSGPEGMLDDMASRGEIYEWGTEPMRNGPTVIRPEDGRPYIVREQGGYARYSADEVAEIWQNTIRLARPVQDQDNVDRAYAFTHARDWASRFSRYRPYADEYATWYVAQFVDRAEELADLPDHSSADAWPTWVQAQPF